METEKIFLFGPQALSIDEEELSRLRVDILKLKQHDWILEAITESAHLSEEFASTIPRFSNQTRASPALLKGFRDWILTGTIPRIPSNLPNGFISPLVVITQLVQFLQYAEVTGFDPAAVAVAGKTETVGLCIGLLAAMAVSSSRKLEDIETHGTAAICLAALVGFVVDAQQESLDDESSSESFAAIWHSEEEEKQMNEILRAFPKVIDLQQNSALFHPSN